MTSWQIASDASPSVASSFGSLGSVFALEGERIASDPLSEVIRVSVDGRRYYVKRYHGAGKGVRRFIGRPRVKAEWENLTYFERLGIPVAPMVAWGLERRHGVFFRGALVTLEVENTIDMAAMAKGGDPRLNDAQWVDRISRQLACATRALHEHRFAHNDLKWRNLLVNEADQLFLIDCPAGDFWWGPFLHHRIVKDLACLDKVAKHQLSRTQRLRFYLQYRQQGKVKKADRKMIQQILSFFEGRE